jgi:hypothetical protein
MAIIQPGPARYEGVTKMSSPILSNKFETASLVTFASKVPAFGVILLKNCSREAESLETERLGNNRDNCQSGIV